MVPTPAVPGRISSFEHDGFVFDVVDRGPVDGEVVVLLHGFPQRGSTWDPVAEVLNAAGLRTLAPDQRGYSPGARPPRRRDYAITRLAADAEALLDRLADAGVSGVHLVGHDWGAAVAWLVAGQHPSVQSLTSVSVPHPAAYLRAMVTSSQAWRSWYLLAFQLPGAAERIAARDPERFALLLRDWGMQDADVARFRRDVLEQGALPGGLGWYRAIPLTLGQAPRLWGQRVSVPVTHVWSTRDRALGRRTAELAGRWATGPYELVVLEGATHWIPEQDPEVLAQVVLERIGSVGRGYSDPPRSRPSAS